MDASPFAKKVMLKYGWSEGKGLGKREDGITEPIKTTLKSDCGGLGYNVFNDTWWDRMYNKSLCNVHIKPQDEDSSFDSKVMFCHSRDIIVTSLTKNNELTEKKFQSTSIFHRGCLIPDGLIIAGEEEKTAQNPVFFQSPIEEFDKLAQYHDSASCDSASCDSASHDSAIPNIAVKLCPAKLKRIALQDQALCNGPSSFGKTTSLMSESSCVVSKDLKHRIESVSAFPLLQPFAVKSKSRARRYRKKINNLTEQLNACSIENTHNEPKCSKSKAIFNYVQWVKKKNISRKIKEYPDKRTKNQEKGKYELSQVIQVETDDDMYISSLEKKSHRLPHEEPEKQTTCSFITMTPKDEDTRINSSKNTTKNTQKQTPKINSNKVRRRQRNRRRRRSKIEDVVKNIVNKRDTDDINTVTKALTEMNLTKDISSKIKKKPTQTHITPV